MIGGKIVSMGESDRFSSAMADEALVAAVTSGPCTLAAPGGAATLAGTLRVDDDRVPGWTVELRDVAGLDELPGRLRLLGSSPTRVEIVRDRHVFQAHGLVVAVHHVRQNSWNVDVQIDGRPRLVRLVTDTSFAARTKGMVVEEIAQLAEELGTPLTAWQREVLGHYVDRPPPPGGTA